MGAFNEVLGKLPCPQCLNLVEIEIQFKYGSVFQHKYKLGEKLIWGGNDVGMPDRARVVLDGEGSKCSSCGYDRDWPVYVYLDNDVITSVTVATGVYDFASVHESFLVLSE